MTSVAPGQEGCYRHPDRPSWTLCQRCGRTICGACQTAAPVGVQCPECIAEARAATVTTMREHRSRVHREQGGTARVWTRRWLGSPAPATIGIIAVTTLVGILQIVMPAITSWLFFHAGLVITQPWRLVTVVLVHAGVLHFVFNMLTLYLVGPSIEQRIGRLPFLAAYLVSAFGGSVAVSLLSPGSAVVGASGAIFGLFGLYIGLQRMLGGTFNVQVLIIVGVNLLIGLFIGGVSWQAHVGGLVIGLALGFWMGRSLRGDARSRGTKVWTPLASAAAACGLLLALALLR